MTGSLRVATRHPLQHVVLLGTCASLPLFALDDTHRPAELRPAGLRPAELPRGDELVPTASAAPPPDIARYTFGVVESGGAVERVVAGAVRCELTATEVRFADSRLVSPIIAAARAKGGWLFLDTDGGVARSDTFLGPLEPLGRVPQAWPDLVFGVLPISDGRLAFPAMDPHASLWTTDGSAPVALAPAAPPGLIETVVFADADHGMIVLDGGALFVTRDGAASFEPVDLGPDGAAAVDVALEHQQFLVTTSSGVIRFDRDGRRIARDATDDAPPGGSTRPDERDVERLYHRVVAAAHQRPETEEVLSPGGTAGGASGPRPPAPVMLACTAHDVARPARVDPLVDPDELSKTGDVRFRRLNADVRLHATSGGRWDVTWRGQDWLGAYAPRHAGGQVAPFRPDAYELLSATRDGVLISTEVDDAGLVWISPGRAPLPLVQLDARADVEDFLPVPGGKLAFLLKFDGVHQPGYRDHALLLLDRDGAVVARRVVHLQDGRTAGIAMSGGTVGVQWTDSDPVSPRWFLPISGPAANRAPAVLDLASMPVCKSPPHRSAVSVLAMEAERPERRSSAASARVYLGHDGHACIQAVELLGPLYSGLDVFATASALGGLRTTLDVREADRVRRLRCDVTRAPDVITSGLRSDDVVKAWARDL